jgi:hypothetical protein
VTERVRFVPPESSSSMGSFDDEEAGVFRD